MTPAPVSQHVTAACRDLLDVALVKVLFNFFIGELHYYINPTAYSLVVVNCVI